MIQLYENLFNEKLKRFLTKENREPAFMNLYIENNDEKETEILDVDTNGNLIIKMKDNSLAVFINKDILNEAALFWGPACGTD